jgi:ubiquitin conjugation factor E4 B
MIFTWPNLWAAAPPNFISDIFYLTLAMSHYGYLRTIQSFSDFGKTTQELQRHLERLQGDGSWMGVR